MKKKISIHLAILALAVSIVLPVNTSVKLLSSNRTVAASAAPFSGTPIPIPTPPGFVVLATSGTPIPIPPPPGQIA
jgi:hypothetical protein